MRDEEIADLSLARLSEMIRDRQITSTRLAGIYLDRIKMYDEGSGINSSITAAGSVERVQKAPA
jgi:Asp-tRNA(Asn)/Glu-tRNA(Gln) amidotransferase A subunit family amidase